MGILNGSQTVYSLGGLETVDVVTILYGLAKEQKMDLPTVDVDCSNAAFKVGKRVDSLVSFLMRWAKPGLRIVPICDGKKRPDCKQASNKRVAGREMNKIKASIIRNDLRQLRPKLYSDVTNRLTIMKEIQKKEKALKSAENQSTNAVPAELDIKLANELDRSSAHAPNVFCGFVDNVMTAEYRADSLMMGRFIQGESLLAVTSDVDIPAITGDNLPALKEFTKDGKLEIVSTSKETILKLKSYLSEKAIEHVTIKDAKHPIFEGVSNRETRALMALYLGCDVLISDLSDRIPGFDVTVVDTYIKALTCEPTNVEPTTTDTLSYWTYLGDKPPEKLPIYLEEFAGDDTVIEAGPKVVNCQGAGNRKHPFIAADGYSKCNECDHIVCNFCRGTIGDDTLCFMCYAQNSLVPLAGEDSTGKPVNEMRNELSDKYNVDNVDELNTEEVEDLYAVREVVNARINGLADAVPFPLHPSDDMDKEEHWKTLMDIDLGEGGNFMADPNLDPKHVPGILGLFASFVTFKSKTRTDHKKDPAIYDAMPEVLIDFADKSRVDSGYRLLARSVRHAFDSRTAPMDDCIAKLNVASTYKRCLDDMVVSSKLHVQSCIIK